MVMYPLKHFLNIFYASYIILFCLLLIKQGFCEKKLKKRYFLYLFTGAIWGQVLYHDPQAAVIVAVLIDVPLLWLIGWEAERIYGALCRKFEISREKLKARTWYISTHWITQTVFLLFCIYVFLDIICFDGIFSQIWPCLLVWLLMGLAIFVNHKLPAKYNILVIAIVFSFIMTFSCIYFQINGNLNLRNDEIKPPFLKGRISADR